MSARVKSPATVSVSRQSVIGQGPGAALGGIVIVLVALGAWTAPRLPGCSGSAQLPV